MALITIKNRSTLAAANVLAPERYSPRRALTPRADDTILLKELVENVGKFVQPSPKLGPCLVLDTSDAREGIVAVRKPSVAGPDIGSAKKRIQPGDVIISRLRPYLRQVALVDRTIPGAKGSLIVGSTEFFVLRSRDRRSIAFLVPFLLSDPVQGVLAASQEGGHHPRFNEEALMTLGVPGTLLRKRKAVSAAIEMSVALFRKCERSIETMVNRASRAFQ